MSGPDLRAAFARILRQVLHRRTLRPSYLARRRSAGAPARGGSMSWAVSTLAQITTGPEEAVL